MNFEQKKIPKSSRNAVLSMQAESRKAIRLVDLLNSGTVLGVLGRTASTRHAAGGATLLRVDLSPVNLLAIVSDVREIWGNMHDGVGNTLEGLLLGFVLKNC